MPPYRGNGDEVSLQIAILADFVAKLSTFLAIMPQNGSLIALKSLFGRWQTPWFNGFALKPVRLYETLPGTTL